MAVVPMQKVRLIVHEADMEAALDIVQRTGAVEFHANEEQIGSEVNVTFPHIEFLPRLQHAIQFLEPFAPQVGLWRTLRDGASVELTESEVAKHVQETDVTKSVVEDMEALQVELAEVQELVRNLEKRSEVLQEWSTLPVPLGHLVTNKTVTRLVKRNSIKEVEPIAKSVAYVLNQENIPHVLTEVSPTQVAVTLSVEGTVLARAEQLIESVGAEIVPTPDGVGSTETELLATTQQLVAAKDELARLYDQAEHFAITHFKNLRVVAEALVWQRDRYAVAEAAVATKHTIVLDGWLNQNKRTDIEARFVKQQLAAVLVDLEPSEDEAPPVEIENSSLIQPFEAVTRLYGMPGYKDLDPTIFLAGFFFLFFGMSLTDVGYGLVLMVIAAMILTLFKVSPPVRMFSKLLLFVGFATVLVGLLFGGYLGIDPKYIPDFLKAIQVYDPIGNPLPVFYTALGLGVVQVMAGMCIRIYSDYRNGKLMEGILDQGPWLFVFSAAILYLGTATGFVSWLSEAQIINVLYVGVAMIIISNARKGETIFARIKNALVSLYQSIGYFSDILSYSRLLALGLATTALAFAVNLIASMVSDVPYVGALLALAILLIGHVFTLAVNTLGAFIHSARLQFVEFFGKFIAGTGKSFAPLARNEKFIAVKKE